MKLDDPLPRAPAAIPRLQYSRRDFYGQLSRHRKKSLAAGLAVLGAAVLLTAMSPKIYQSQSLLYVRLGRENVTLDPTTTMGQASVISVPNSRESEINSVVEIIRSRAIAERVVDSLGAEVILGLPAGGASEAAEQGTSRWGVTGLRGLLQRLNLTRVTSLREQAIGQLSEGLTARALPKTDLLSISYRAESPQLAQQVVQTLTQVYLDQHAGLNRPPNAQQFLEQQTERLAEELARTEQELSGLKRATELAAPTAQMELAVTRLYRLQDDLWNTQALVAGSQAEIAALNAQLGELSESRIESVTTGQNNPAADGMRQLLYSLQLQEKKIAGLYTDDHPLMTGIREQIAQSQSILNQEQESRQTITEGPNRTYEELNIARLRQESLLQAAQVKAAKLQEQVAAAGQQLETQIENELRVARLERQLQLQDASYRTYYENLEQGNIDQALEQERISNINVVQPASLVDRPVAPNVLLNLIAGVFGGLVAAVGIAIAWDVSDHSLKSPEEIEQKLNLPLLVSIPRLDRRGLQIMGSTKQ